MPRASLLKSARYFAVGPLIVDRPNLELAAFESARGYQVSGARR
jgi:hypothetical protein